MATALWDEGDWDETDWAPEDLTTPCVEAAWDEGDWDTFCWGPVEPTAVGYGPGWLLEWGGEAPHIVLRRKRRDEIEAMLRAAFARATDGAPKPVLVKAAAIVAAPKPPPAGASFKPVETVDWAAVVNRTERQLLAVLRRLEALEREADDEDVLLLMGW